ncbi:MAG: glycosyltransferase family 2 protein, partial [Chlamydiota bacterium]
MKRTWLSLGVLICLFVGFFFYEYDARSSSIPQLKKLKKESSKDVTFVFIVPINNCSEIVEKIISSILEQSYKNYRAILIDDGSNDATYQIAKDFISHYKCEDKFTLIRNNKRIGSVENLYEQVQNCKDDEVIVFFQGNCWLADDITLQRLNEVYKNYDIWLTYSQHINYRTKEKASLRKVTSKNLFSHSMRRKFWQRSRLKTFYAGLFKQINLQDFFFRGKFIHDSFDKAYMFPMMEMAGKHVAFLPETYCYFLHKSLKAEKRPSNLSPYKCEKKITTTPSYQPLKVAPYISDKKPLKTADILIFSYDRPLQLYATLESIYTNFQNLQDVAILYRASDDRFACAYEVVKSRFPKAHFVKQSKNFKSDFKPLLLKILKEHLKSEYIAFSVDDMVVKEKVDLSEATDYLNRTNAFFFSLRLGYEINYCYMGGYSQKIPHHVKLLNNVLAWQIDTARGDWNYYHSVDM